MISAPVTSAFKTAHILLQASLPKLCLRLVHSSLQHFIHSLGFTARCLLAGGDLYCTARYGAWPLQLGTPFFGRDGDGYVLLLNRRPRPVSAGPQLLQL